MLELAIDARRGSFRLHLACHLTASWTVVFGPSGAGKSTLLRLLAGLDREIVGREKARVVHEGTFYLTLLRTWLSPGRRSAALVAQQPALFPHLSVRSNVAYGIAHLPRRDREQRVERVLDLVGGLERMDRRPQGLSGGEAQRVALARAPGDWP